MADITLGIAFIAGIASFISPCILPLIPAFLSYLTGTGLKEAERSKAARLKIFLNSVFFVLGFAVVFSILGVILNNLLADTSQAIQTWASRIGGTLIIIFGLYMVRLLNLPFLEREYKLKVTKFKYSYPTSFVFGAAFAIGWTPCVGAVLGSILTLAALSPGQAFNLLLAYTLGLGIPFLIIGLFVAEASRFFAKAGKFLKYFSIVMGILLIILGILVFTNKLSLIANLSLLNRFFL